ncbi:hypothetical protein EON65_20020 [archaeon]|nr:MAG: hypothetical protein EON65_20020 [archaeon]
MPRLPKLETSECAVDISMLDVMAVEDFLSLLKSKTDNNNKELWRETCALVSQLKAARELLSIGSSLLSNRSNKKIVDRLIDVACILLSAEKVHVFEVDGVTKELLMVTHSKDENAIGAKVSTNNGIEGKFKPLFCLRF